MWVEEFLAWAQGNWERQKSDEKTVTAKRPQKLDDLRQSEPTNPAVEETPNAPVS